MGEPDQRGVRPAGPAEAGGSPSAAGRPERGSGPPSPPSYEAKTPAPSGTGRAEIAQRTASRVLRRVAALDAKLPHIPEPAMHRSLVREALIEARGDERYAFCSAVMGRRPRERSGRDRLRDALYAVLLGGQGSVSLGYEHRAALYARAAEQRDEPVLRALRSQRPREYLECPESRLPKDLADIPLGRRRHLAKGGEGYLLEGLARDPDPLVIRHLLTNPRLREEDVVRIAALRPVVASTLAEIERSPRWSRRPRIRAAVARNPYCPPELAVALVRGLRRQDLREICRDPSLHPETVRQAEAELALREGTDL